MFKNTKTVFLAAVVAMMMIVSPFGAAYVSARTITDQVITDQEQVIRDSAREVVEQYTRLLLYIIISRLEAQVEARA